MILYRIQSKSDGLGPYSSRSNFVEYVGVDIEPHTEPQYMGLTDDVRDAVNGGQYLYFFTDLHTLCALMHIYHPRCPTSKGSCRIYTDWGIVFYDTVDAIENVDYYMLEDGQAMVHERLQTHFEVLS